VILIDSNIPMCLIGAAHPRKADAQRLLEKLIAGRERLVTDAEVLQEILHRYVAIDRREAIQPAFDALLGVVDEVVSVESCGGARKTDCARVSAVVSARRDPSLGDGAEWDSPDLEFRFGI